LATEHPTIGGWYENLGEGVTFQVTALDERRHVVRISDTDRGVRELSLKEWAALDVEPIEAPDHVLDPLDDEDYEELELSDRGEEWTEFEVSPDEDLSPGDY